MNPTESKLFSPFQIGNLMIDNRFIRSATFESAANDDGSVSEDYAKIYRRLAKGKIGMIITGMISISEEGKSYKRQASLHSDEMIPDFSQLLNQVHTQTCTGYD
jgi:2,4-dienoyl-CoA reductase-like NADH-dependent reductase (Old Yellow Enzyme family)